MLLMHSQRNGYCHVPCFCETLNRTTLPIRIYPTIIDKINWLFVQTNKKLDNTSIAVLSLTGSKLYEQKTGILQAGQMVSFPLDAESLSPGTYLLQLFSGSEMVYKRKISLG
jgi:hypothetical protein